jgi:selenocysteine lyase/cysteine desulfurase
MGYEQDALWRLHRHQFPVTENLIYLNHAAVAPLAKPAADAMSWWIDDALRFGSNHYIKWLDACEQLRVSTARMIGAHRDEIAIVKNTSEGIAFVSNGLDWKSGDRVIAFREEFPANYYPWQRLEARGVKVDWLSINDPLEVLDKACAGARLLAISFVNYLSGYRVDLNAIGEICSRHGTFFFVDAIQGMGVYPIDVQRAKIDALSADGHKWMFGPEGCGVFYIRKEQQDRVEPVEFGWTNVAKYADYASRDMTLRPNAGRYECGTLNTISIFGLRAAIEYINEIGVENIGQAVDARAGEIAAGVAEKGYEVMGSRTPESSSGIVTFRKEGLDSWKIVAELQKQGVIAAPRQGWVRTSPHFYTPPDQITRMLELLP